jgi:hypothetical protein
MELAFDPLDASSSASPDDTSGAGAYGVVQGWPALVEPSRLVPLPSSMSAALAAARALRPTNGRRSLRFLRHHG